MPLSTRNVLTPVNTGSNTGAHTRTVSYTVGAGTELLVVIARISAGEIWAANAAACRWADSSGNNDEALTQAVTRVSAGGAGARTQIWYLVNPTARAGRLEIDYTVTSSSIQATSWTILEVVGGVDTAAPIGATGSAVGTTAAAPLSLTSTVAGSLILSGLTHANNTAEPYTPAAGITAELADGQTGTTAGNDHSYWAGECLTTTVGAYAVGTTGAGSAGNYAIAAVEILPSTGTGTSYTYTADGGATSGGVAPLALSAAPPASGGAIAAGVAALVLGGSLLASGGAQTGGSAGVAYEPAVQASGGAQSGGVADVVFTPAGTQEYVATGGAQSGGAATLGVGWPFQASGGAQTGGSATVVGPGAAPAHWGVWIGANWNNRIGVVWKP